MMRAPAGAGRARGFTLLDALISCALAGVLATVAVPTYQGSVQKARRADAVAALTRIEFAQGGFRANHGLYSADLNALGQRAALTPEGHYRLSVSLLGADGYLASARVVEGGAQHGDADCAELTLQVRQERVIRGPSPHCWLR